MTNPIADRALPSRLPHEEAVIAVKERVQDSLCGGPALIRDCTARLTESSGKFLRAECLLSCSWDAEGQVAEDAVLAAAGVELIHLATLVHDDVMDQAEWRRGKPSLRTQIGNRRAVICGDYLLSQGLRQAMDVKDRQRYLSLQIQDYVALVCLGELRQHTNNGNLHLSALEYYRIISGKTAALFEASFLMGAITGGVSEDEWGMYKRLGHYLGMIFQIMDDCLDFELDFNTRGKSVQSDYEQGVVTLPLLYTLQENPDFLQIAEKAREKLDQSTVNQAVSEGRGLTRSRNVAARYAKKYQEAMERLALFPAKAFQLSGLLQRALKFK